MTALLAQDEAANPFACPCVASLRVFNRSTDNNPPVIQGAGIRQDTQVVRLYSPSWASWATGVTR